MIGNREGLAGNKSGLFYQAVRIIKEMRCSTNGLYPVITVWENVPGAFSSNDRMDFRAVLESLAGPLFQCLLPGSGQMPEWCEVMTLSSDGASWTPDIEEAPCSYREENASSSWQILEESVPEKYSLSPAGCAKLLCLASKAGTPPPKEIEVLLLKQGGTYPSSIHSGSGGFGAPQRNKIRKPSLPLSDVQMTLFPLCSPKPQTCSQSGFPEKRQRDASAALHH